MFDEFDSIGTTRHASNEVGEIKRVLNSFLLQIEKDESRSLIIAATNMPESLDNALFRRFDDILRFPLPTESDISHLLELELKSFGFFPIFDINQIAKASVGLSFADIHRICTDVVKDALVYGENTVSQERVLQYVMDRKNPF